METNHPRIRSALRSISRSDFINGKDLPLSTTGHSIPRAEVVGLILSILPDINPTDVVMHVGGGSGYFAAVLSKLTERVLYVEQNTYVAEAAKERFERLGLTNIEVIPQSAESNIELDKPL
ncbi:hypothetical protein WG219_10790 [Ectopseudomonas mendocina]|uniref:Protein-L-isoaspartate O-methyltransferase n=1 Tax=Ectopseudomonas mendocina TaxID=300 RepID=A0ABZ2RLK7_ECTME